MARRKKPDGNKSKRRSLERGQRNRQPQKSILVVCEGQETEPNYFKALCRAKKLRTVKVDSGTGKTAATQIVERAKSLREERKEKAKVSYKLTAYDEVWCVFDREHQHENQSFEQSVEAAREHSINLAVSNPAFEYWYLLHFEHTASAFKDGKTLKQYLKKHLENYDESVDVYALIESHMETAIERAKLVLHNHDAEDGLYLNPSTHVHKIVEQLIY